MFQFSTDQIKAIDGVLDTLLESDPNSHSIAILTGSAGTGKTTVVTELIARIKDKDPMLDVSLCASTHRAAAVLQDIVGEPAFTGHSLFKLAPSITQYGKEVLKKNGLCNIPYGSVVIIDESSMISDTFLKAIVSTVKERKLKVLFVGDPFQLPPITDKCSLFDGSLPTFTLTQVHRQAGGNPVLEKANEFREYIEGIRQHEPTLATALNAKGEGIHVLPHSDFVSKFVEKYMGYSAGAEVDIPLCTYTNESAINYNNMIRKTAYFLEDTIKPFYPGERLVANSIVMYGEKIFLSNNEIVYVEKYREDTYFDIPGYNVTVKGDFCRATNSKIKSVFVPRTKREADIVLKQYKDIAKQNKNKSDWVTFYKLKKALADLRPPFAGTTHKAQGGTFPAVFIDKVNINKCRDVSTKARLVYVALTRASKHVYINS